MHSTGASRTPSPPALALLTATRLLGLILWRPEQTGFGEKPQAPAWGQWRFFLSQPPKTGLLTLPALPEVSLADKCTASLLTQGNRVVMSWQRDGTDWMNRDNVTPGWQLKGVQHLQVGAGQRTREIISGANSTNSLQNGRWGLLLRLSPEIREWSGDAERGGVSRGARPRELWKQIVCREGQMLNRCPVPVPVHLHPENKAPFFTKSLKKVGYWSLLPWPHVP